MTARWNKGVWISAGGLLLVPLVAMRFTREVAWTGEDFVAAALLLGGAAGAYELLTRRAHGWSYRAGAAVAVLAGLSLMWVNLAVGMIGDEGDLANRMFAGVIGVAVGGACAARLRPQGMAWTMLATAATQASVAAVALVLRWGEVGEVAGTGAAWTAAWLVTALLFARAHG